MIRSAFESGDPDVLDVFRHPSQPKKEDGYTAGFIQNGRRIAATRIEKYEQPDWEVFESCDLYPPPEFIIWVELDETDRWGPTTLFFACGRSGNGYCFCFYYGRGEDPLARRPSLNPMSAEGWDVCETPYPMFDYLGRGATARKLRLFGIACCRRVWHLLPREDCRRAVILAEQLVEGQAEPEAVRELREGLKREYLASVSAAVDPAAASRLWGIGAAKNLLQDSGDYLQGMHIGPSDADLLLVWSCAASVVAHAHVESYDGPPPRELGEEHRAQADLLREIFGNPLRPVAFDPGWRTPTVLALARQIYGNRSFELLPVLADALEEAGCLSNEVLTHCRAPGAHVRGCWALDLVQGEN